MEVGGFGESPHDNKVLQTRRPMNSRSLPPLTILPGEFVIVRFPATPHHRHRIGRWLVGPEPQLDTQDRATDSTEVVFPCWQSVTWSEDEISVVASVSALDELINFAGKEAPSPQISSPRRVIKIIGPLPLEWVGILAGLAKVLADVEVSLFCVATFDTDYVLVESAQVDLAVAALESANYRFE